LNITKEHVNNPIEFEYPDYTRKQIRISDEGQCSLTTIMERTIAIEQDSSVFDE